MAMLLLAAGYLAGRKDSFDGTLHFIFQPAEENEGGAQAMIKDGLFEKFPVDAVFGLHNFPVLPFGSFAICPGPVMAACDIFEITVHGKGGHAAMPHLARDPLLAAAQMVAAFQSIVSRNLDPLEAALISVTQFQGGSAWNIIPETVVLRGTARSFREEVQQLLESRLREITAGVAAAAGVEADLNYQRLYPPTVNTDRETGQAVRAACRVAAAEQVITNMKPQMGSEDFSFMLKQRPGAYICLGSAEPGRNTMLHQPDYDFNDHLLPLGAAYWISLVELLLPGQSSQGACKNGLSD
jgi:hippurate hydrolase